MMKRVDQRHVRPEARARQRCGGVRVDHVERTTPTDLLQRPRNMIQIGKHVRRPLRLLVQAVQFRASPRIASREEHDFVATLYKPFSQIVHDQLGTTIEAWWYGN